MKKNISVILAVALLISAVYFTVSGTGYESFYADGKDTVLPDSASGSGVFIGWTAKVNGRVILIAPGETYTSDTGADFEPVFVRFSMIEGASVRYTAPVGLRFTTRVNEGDYQRLSEISDDVSFGTLISTEDIIKGDFTKEAIENDGGVCLEIPARVWMSQSSGERRYTGVIAEIKESNHGRRFCARPYVKVGYTSGENRTLYGSFDPENNSRSVSYVSSRAVNDKTNTFSAEQIAALSSFFEIKEININMASPKLNAKVEDAYTVDSTYNYTVLTGWECQFLGKKPEIFLSEYAYRSLIAVKPAEAMIITENTKIIYNGVPLKDKNGSFIKKTDSIENNRLYILREYQPIVSWVYGLETVCASCTKTLYVNTLSICPYCDGNIAENKK